ncbi:ImmA/IrrE family metallo-endopeptidase [Luteipulveratus halotolerans]|uniref:ImmA/IrrE family metallo-endopeptidase n=1 Tax=Luteipulveratus halotolerans TaxID=1631356 RepID=UPI000682FAE1|nr:ImmA/IrrE family metallo-endopeptidase [Luteipulveratus halotolerans]
MWGRGDEPLPNLVQLSEAHGVRVLSLPSGADAVDAFSLWNDERPYVLLSTAKSAERSRFDLAHELGHLVMHSRVAVGADPRALEREADEFASALLMPREALAAHAGREPAVPEILRLRSHYRVSAMAMTRRLHDIGRLTDWAYRQDCVHLAQRGFRSGEPGGMARERSRVFDVVFPALDRAGTVVDACRALGITLRELHGLTLGQVAVAVDGIGQSALPATPNLRLVT